MSESEAPLVEVEVRLKFEVETEEEAVRLGQAMVSMMVDSGFQVIDTRDERTRRGAPDEPKELTVDLGVEFQGPAARARRAAWLAKRPRRVGETYEFATPGPSSPPSSQP